MKRCLSCDTHHTSITQCPSCDYKSIVINGFDSYSPELAHNGGGFRPDYFAELASLENTNFWFKARNQLILWALEKYCGEFHSFLEIGCGTGYVLSGVAHQFPNKKLYGSEIFVEGLNFAATRLPTVKLMQMDARNIPFHEEFDVIGAFDVLEHIKEDDDVLAQIYLALRPHGYILLTVPQHQWLWSAVDEYACHERRYSAADLHKKLIASGFQIIHSTSFVSLLLPAMLFSRANKKKGAQHIDSTNELKLSQALSIIFYKIMLLELSMIKRGIRFPAGGSRLVIAKKMN